MLADVFIAAVVMTMTVIGYRRGAIVSILGALAVVAGGVFGMAVGTLEGGTWPAVLAVAGGGIAALGYALCMPRIQIFVDAQRGASTLGQVDRAFGIIINVGLLLGLVWLVGVVLSIAPSKSFVANSVHASRAVNAMLTLVSPTGDLAAAVLRTGLLPALGGPLIIVDPPDDDLVTAPAIARAALSVVQISGSACNSINTGTGWVVAPGLVVTNAHVVAGQRTTAVLVRGVEPEYPTTVVGFDPVNDIAVLQVAGLPLVPLLLNDAPQHGLPGVMIGYPRTNGLVLRAVRFDRTVDFPIRDIYERGPTQSSIAAFRGDVNPGNSGSPLVDPDGRVMATAAASTANQAVEGGYAVPNNVVRLLLADLRNGVSTGPCLPPERAGKPRAL